MPAIILAPVTRLQAPLWALGLSSVNQGRHQALLFDKLLLFDPLHQLHCFLVSCVQLFSQAHIGNCLQEATRTVLLSHGQGRQNQNRVHTHRINYCLRKSISIILRKPDKFVPLTNTSLKYKGFLSMLVSGNLNHATNCLTPALGATPVI